MVATPAAVGYVLPDLWQVISSANETKIQSSGARAGTFEIGLALPHGQVEIGSVEDQPGVPPVEVHRAGKQVKMVAGRQWPRVRHLDGLQRNALADQPGRDAMHELQHHLAPEHADHGTGRIVRELDHAAGVLAPGFHAEIVEDQVEELPEAVQRHLQPWRVEQAQAEVLERAIAQWPAENARHLVVEFLGEQAVQRRKLFLRDPRRGLGQQLGRNPRAVRQPGHGLRIGTRQEAIDDGDGNGGGKVFHAGRWQCVLGMNGGWRILSQLPRAENRPGYVLRFASPSCCTRHFDTLQPNSPPNQRENALSDENPSSVATSDKGRSRLRYSAPPGWRALH